MHIKDIGHSHTHTHTTKRKNTYNSSSNANSNNGNNANNNNSNNNSNIIINPEETITCFEGYLYSPSPPLLTYGTIERQRGALEDQSAHSNHTNINTPTSSKTTTTTATTTVSMTSTTMEGMNQIKAQSEERVEEEEEGRLWLNPENDDEDGINIHIDPECEEKCALTNNAATPNITANITAATTTTKKLSLLSLTMLVFYNVSGGPFGIEPSIHSAGNLYAILGFTIAPLVWSIPEALMTAELGSTFRHDASGGVAWVEEAFGRKWGMVCGLFSWISGAADNAIYPTLFLQYLVSVLQMQHSSSTSTSSSPSNDTDYNFNYENDYENEYEYDFGENTIDSTTMWYDNAHILFAFVSVLSILLALLNYCGLEIVGSASIVVCIVAMSPFVIMTALGIPQIDPNRWLQLPDAGTDADNNINASGYSYGYDYEEDVIIDDGGNGSSNPQLSTWLQTVMGSTNTTTPTTTTASATTHILWAPYLNNLFWNLNSFDAAASFAGEVQSPSKTYPNGIFWGLFLSIIFYLVPLLVATGATDYKQNEWVDGQLGKAAIDIGGNWLGAWTVFAAGISNLALFEAELSSDSYQLMGMAQRGYLPKLFARRSQRYGTPTNGILTCTLVIIALSVADFTQLVELLNFNYAISLLMEYAAFVKLRLTRKDLERPYRIPIPDWAVIFIIIPPCLGILLLFSIANWVTYAFVLSVLLLGLALYYSRELAQHKGLCTFVNEIETETASEHEADHDFEYSHATPQGTNNHL